jgi:hypothetical protein
MVTRKRVYLKETIPAGPNAGSRPANTRDPIAAAAFLDSANK